MEEYACKKELSFRRAVPKTPLCNELRDRANTKTKCIAHPM